MGNHHSSSSSKAPPTPLSCSDHEDFPEPPQPPRQFRAEAEHSALLPGRPEYEFFDGAFGLVNQYMQAQYRRLVNESLRRTVGRGFITWSAIERLNAPNYTAAINQTVQLLRNCLVQGYRVDTVHHLGELIGEIIRQREREMLRADQRDHNKPEERRTHQHTIECWRKAQSSLARMTPHRRDRGPFYN